jgi:hypothetical protein
MTPLDPQTTEEILAFVHPWLPFVQETGGNPIERLLPGETNVWVNAPLALIEQAVQAQVLLLHRLRANGLLVEPSPTPPPINATSKEGRHP